MAESYKSPFANTPSAPKPKDPKRKKGFFEKMGERFGDAAADYLLDEDTNPATSGGKDKKK